MSLSYTQDMSWREFQLHRIGYLRQEKEEWKRARLTSYFSLVATGAIDTKKMSIEKFMPMEDGTNVKANSTGLDAYKRAMEQYNKETNG